MGCRSRQDAETGRRLVWGPRRCRTPSRGRRCAARPGVNAALGGSGRRPAPTCPAAAAEAPFVWLSHHTLRIVLGTVKKNEKIMKHQVVSPLKK